MLRFYVGEAGSGKSRRMFTDIIGTSMKHPERNFLVIVPEQFSLSAQRTLVSLHPKHGLLNIDVLSLERLAYRIFAETGALRKELLEESGKSLVLRRIILQEKEHLPYLGTRLLRNGSTADIKSVLSELAQYNITPDELRSARTEGNGLLSRKLADLTHLYEAYLSYLADHYMTAEEVPLRLASLIDRSSTLPNTVVAFDGFTGFTPVQLPVLAALMRVCPAVLMTVTAPPDTDFAAPFAENDLFSMSRKMAAKLLRIADEVHCPVRPPVQVFESAKSRQAASPVLTALTASVFRPAAGGKNAPHEQTAQPAVSSSENIGIAAASEPAPHAPGRPSKEDPAETVFLTSCANPLAEVYLLAHRIRALVRTKGLRYREIAVISGDPARYGDLIKRVFPSEGIPYFLDEKRSLLINPFVEFLRAAMEIFSEGWRAEGIFRLLRTGLAGFTAEETDRLENYVLALGIRGRKRWSEPFVLHYRSEDPAELLLMESLRQRLTALLLPVEELFAKRAGTAGEKTKALYLLCTSLQIQQQLAEKAARLSARGLLDAAREYEQVYAIIMDLFDKIVLVLKDTPISMDDYRSMLESAFSEARVGIAPPSGDAVMAGDVIRSRLDGIRVLFFLGVNDGLVPQEGRPSGILTEADRLALQGSGIHLSPDARETLDMQRFYLYLALSKPSEKLFLSWARNGSDGAPLRPSFLIDSIRGLFPSLSVTTSEEALLLPPETTAEGLRILPRILQLEAGDREAASGLELYRYLKYHPKTGESAARILTAAAARKPQDAIGKEAARALYGANLRASASRMETYALCPFRHFAAYGLSLADREEYTYEGADRGTVLHAALEAYAETLLKEGRLWQDLTEEEQGILADRCVTEATESYKSRLLFDSATAVYEITRLKRLMLRSVRTLTEQLRYGDFVPSGFEVSFRFTDSLAAAHFSLADGASLSLTGRIDRIDICRAGDRILVKVIDYKSANTKFDPVKVYYGLTLQLPLYMNAALELTTQQTGLTADPAGIFYYVTDDPVVDYDPSDTKEALSKKLLKKLKASGLVSSEPEALFHLDRGLGTEYSSSDVIPVGYLKNGSLSSGSSAVSEELFRTVLSYTERKTVFLAEHILEGDTAPSPASYRDSLACDYCPYRSVCRFNPRDLARIRQLPDIPDKELYTKMENEL